MKCFKYEGGKTTQGIEVSGNKLKTCEILVKLPNDWNSAQFIHRVKDREFADVFLYTCIELCEGDTVSSIFPETCFVLELPCPLSYTNHNNSALELEATCDHVVVAMFADSCVYDKDTNKYITNDGGQPKVGDEPPADGPEVLDDNTSYLVF